MISASNFAVTVALTVSKSSGPLGIGTGTITSSPGGINCGPNCSAFYNLNSCRHPDSDAGHSRRLQRLDRMRYGLWHDLYGNHEPSADCRREFSSLERGLSPRVLFPRAR